MRTKDRRIADVIALVVIIILMLVFILFFNNTCKPVVSTFAQTTAMNHATQSINEAVEEYLHTLKLTYADIANLQYDVNGEITAVKIDSISLNQIKIGVAAKLAELFSSVQTAELKIPIGTLSGSNLFAGKGIAIPLSVSYSAASESELGNVFITRGINQTQHQIVLQVHTQLQVLSYGKMQCNKISTQITVAETVIVGTIPEIYAGADDELWPNLVE